MEETASQLSSASSTGPDEIKIEIRFDGHWEHVASGRAKYVGGKMYWEKVPSKLTYASLMHRMSAKINGAVLLKYAPPGEDITDPEDLVTCVDNEHVQEMLEEFWKAKAEHRKPGKTFRLQVWLYKADEEDIKLEDIEGFDGADSSSGSTHSSASAGTGANHVNSRKMNYTPSTPLKPSLDVEMQQKEAQQVVTWMAEQEEVDEANWQAHLAHNLNRAHECTYDSCGWPHDRSPFVRAMNRRLHAQQSISLAVGHNASSQKNQSLGRQSSWMGMSPRMLARGIISPQDYSPQPDVPISWPEATPMDSATPTTQHFQAAQYYTQDPYRLELDGGGQQGQQVTADGKAAGAYFLPSLLGSEVGNAFHNTADAAEKAHIENMVAGMVHYALQDGSADGHQEGTTVKAGSGPVLRGVSPEMVPSQSLYRTPSRLGLSYDNVYRIPQTEIHVVNRIGEGTFGDVVLASNEVFGRVAVKWLKPAKMEKHQGKFWEEARMLAALNHPNVLRFYGIVTAGPGDPTVVGIMTEYMNGSSLSNYLRSGIGRISLLQRAELAREAVNGLAYLHSMNIVHFDLKPDNLLLDRALCLGYETPGVKVADFGLSKQKVSKYVSGVRDLRGTLPYMAPELVSDPDHVSESADVWSLGIVLWEMLTMETPFQHLTPQQIITGLMMGQLRPEIPEDCEPEWMWLLDGCLRTHQAERLTLREIGLQLDRIIQEAPPGLPVSPY